MIDFLNITRFDRSPAEQEEMMLFGVAVAGKKSAQAASKLDAFLGGMLPRETPFEYIRRLGDRGWLGPVLREHRLSPYSQKEAAFRALARTDITTATVADLEAIPFVGPKTARFFVLHNRAGARHAVLDTHILAWLREQGHRAPRQTPAHPPTYRRLEQAFLEYAEGMGMAPADLDLKIWTERSRA